MNKMIVSNLLHRPVRSLISVVAVALEVTLILLMVGLATGQLQDSQDRQRGMGGDLIFQPPSGDRLSGLSGAPMSIKYGDILAKLPHVKVVAPIVWHLNTQAAIEVIYGIDLKSFEELGGPFHYLSGGPYQGPNDVIVDDYFAASKHRKVGDTIELFNRSFRICGIVEHGRGARKFVPMATLQELTGDQNKVSVFYLKLDSPDNLDTVIQEIKSYRGLENYSARSMAEQLSMMTVTNMPGLTEFIAVVIGVAMVIGFIVIFQAMYTAIMERTREIGILKSLGASRLYIMNVILRETALLAAFGIVLGVVVSFSAQAIIVHRIPTLRMAAPTLVWIGYATLIAIVGAMLGAFYPAIKAARKDPIDALAYE